MAGLLDNMTVVSVRPAEQASQMYVDGLSWTACQFLLMAQHISVALHQDHGFQRLQGGVQ